MPMHRWVFSLSEITLDSGYVQSEIDAQRMDCSHALVIASVLDAG